MRGTCLALLACVASSFTSPAAQTERPAFPEERLQELVGKSAKLCGTVAEYSCRVGRDTEVHLWSRPSELGITVRVPLASRPRFGLAFEGRTLNREVCAAGPISREGPRFVVQVGDPAAFSFEKEDEPRGVPPNVVSPCDQNVEIPKLLGEVKPAYTRAALSAGIAGDVWMDAIVGTDGRPRSIRIVRSLDRKYGLDQEAIKALEQWRFDSGLHEGRPAPVRIVVSMTFVLKK